MICRELGGLSVCSVEELFVAFRVYLVGVVCDKRQIKRR